MLTPTVPEQLRSSVTRIVGFEELDAFPVRRRELPIVGTPIILAFGAPYRLSLAGSPDLPVQSMPQFVAGLHDAYTTSESTGMNWTIQIDLSPLGAYQILDVPMSSLTNRLVTIEELFGREGRILGANLEATERWDARFRLVIAFLLSRLSRARCWDPAISWVWQQMVCAQGNVTIDCMTEELAWSHRRLIETFQEQIGMTPKKVFRQLRFLNAADLIRSSPTLPLVDIATAAGYFDQSHFSRDFRSFAGITPGQFRHESSGPLLDSHTP